MMPPSDEVGDQFTAEECNCILLAFYRACHRRLKCCCADSVLDVHSLCPPSELALSFSLSQYLCFSHTNLIGIPVSVFTCFPMPVFFFLYRLSSPFIFEFYFLLFHASFFIPFLVPPPSLLSSVSHFFVFLFPLSDPSPFYPPPLLLSLPFPLPFLLTKPCSLLSCY